MFKTLGVVVMSGGPQGMLGKYDRKGGGLGSILTGSIHFMRLWCSSGLLGNLGQAVGGGGGG